MKFEYTENDKKDFMKDVKKTYLKDGKETCWLWKGKFTAEGYGQYYHPGGVNSAHRFSFLIYKGKIEPGNIIDHKCRTRSCVNPKHLQQITQKRNLELRYMERDENDPDENYVNQRIEPLTKLQQCIRQLENEWVAVCESKYGGCENGKKSVIEILKIFLSGHVPIENRSYGDDLIDGYKEKYFAYFYQTMNDYEIKFETLVNHYKKEGDFTDNDLIMATDISIALEQLQEETN